MTDAIPNLWPKKFSRGILTPLAVLRVQAAKFKDMTEGLLEAEVTTNWEREDLKVHSLELIAPALDSYRRVILTVRHAHPGAYPLWLRSDFLSGSVEDYDEDHPSGECGSQEELFSALRQVFASRELSTLVESLIAQINDAEAVPA